jgi:hypothetical protein
MKTIKLIDQLRASRMIYDKALQRVEALSDTELRQALVGPFASDSTLDRIAAVASKSTLDRIAAVASDSTLARIAAAASGSTLDRIAAVASDSTMDRIAAVASKSTLDRIAAVASDSTLDRIAAAASGSTLDRIAAVASDSTMDRIKILTELEVPIVEGLDQKVCAAAEAGKRNMRQWHCGTTHCRAGWAITLAGEAGTKLENVLGSEAAGRLIYEASTGRVAPDFHASNEAAIADIRHCAGVSE